VHYRAVLSETQIQIINRALDLFSRLLIGQVEHLDDIYIWRQVKTKQFDMDKFRKLCFEIKQLVFGFSQGESFGIHGPKTPEDAQIAWDIQQVFRHRLSWDRVGNPPSRDWKTMNGVNFDNPLKSSTEPLCTIRKVLENDKGCASILEELCDAAEKILKHETYKSSFTHLSNKLEKAKKFLEEHKEEMVNCITDEVSKGKNVV